MQRCWRRAIPSRFRAGISRCYPHCDHIGPPFVQRLCPVRPTCDTVSVILAKACSGSAFHFVIRVTLRRLRYRELLVPGFPFRAVSDPPEHFCYCSPDYLYYCNYSIVLRGGFPLKHSANRLVFLHWSSEGIPSNSLCQSFGFSLIKLSRVSPDQ